MSDTIDYGLARDIMGRNFIGVDELKAMESVKFLLPDMPPAIPFKKEVLDEKKEDYLLVLGVSRFSDGKAVTIRSMTEIFGKDPDIMEPCFYNQDWYDKEDFIDIPMRDGWYLIRSCVYEDSRAVQPGELLRRYSFPSAVSCTYTFFTAWQIHGRKLWYHDFVWCSDTDHNGDRIYVGRYHDVDGVNKNGFSIHRHLALRLCYACID